ncbi:MAG: hypothetical protein ACMXYL_05700 [Candidatus Woesearchaeota archaeon]
MGFPAYFVSALVVYLSGIGGLLLYRGASDELIKYHSYLRIALASLFSLIFGLFSFSAFPNNPEIAFLMLFSIILISLNTMIWKDIYFVFLSVIFSLSYLYSDYFIIISTLIFAYGMLSFGMCMEKKSFKRLMIRRLPFVILVLFGFLLTFSL